MSHRFFLPTITPTGNTITITDAGVIKQITNVLRLTPGDRFQVFDGTAEYVVTILTIASNMLTVSIFQTLEPLTDPQTKVILYQSLLKKDNFEWVLQKGVELGVHAFVPVVTDRTITRSLSPHKIDRYEKIVTEATEQCGGGHRAFIDDVRPFSEAVTLAAGAEGEKVIAWEAENSTSLESLLSAAATTYHIFIGPEGGYTPDEIALAEQNGIRTVSLGKRILRAETAAIAVSTIILLRK